MLYEKSITDRFWSKVNKDGRQAPHMPTRCWEWTGGKMKSGHGVFYPTSHPNKAAHRVSWEIHNGEIPKDPSCKKGTKYVLHHCDNASCVRPDHLYLGTQADNVADRVARGNTVMPDNRGEKHGLSKLTEADVIAIRAKLAESNETQASIAKTYGVCQSSISRIMSKENWHHAGLV